MTSILHQEMKADGRFTPSRSLSLWARFGCHFVSYTTAGCFNQPNQLKNVHRLWQDCREGCDAELFVRLPEG